MGLALFPLGRQPLPGCPKLLPFFLFDSFSIILSVLSELCGEIFSARVLSLNRINAESGGGTVKGHDIFRGHIGL